MPVQRCAFRWIGNLVMDRHLDCIAPICFDRWAGELAVHKQNAFIYAVWGYVTSCNRKVVFSYNSCVWRVRVWIRVVGRLRAPGIPIRKWVIGFEVWKLWCFQRALKKSYKKF